MSRFNGRLLDVNSRALVIWCSLGSGAAALFWMCNVLLDTNRAFELALVALLGSTAMGLLARQAKRAGSEFGAYFGFTVSTLCFLMAAVTGIGLLQL